MPVCTYFKGNLLNKWETTLTPQMRGNPTMYGGTFAQVIFLFVCKKHFFLQKGTFLN